MFAHISVYPYIGLSIYLSYNIYMSWFMFKEAPAVQARGKKVYGFQDMHRPKINLSWGINQGKTYAPASRRSQHQITPILFEKNEEVEDCNANMKILTDTSEDESQELVKLMRKQNDDRKKQRENNSNNKKSALNMLAYSIEEKPKKHKQYDKQALQIQKRMRFLQNSLLPQSKRQNMAPIMDYDLGKEVRMEESRVSGRSLSHNKKNESNVVLGEGFNPYVAEKPKQIDFSRRLQQMYEYEERVRQREGMGQIRLG